MSTVFHSAQIRPIVPSTKRRASMQYYQEKQRSLNDTTSYRFRQTLQPSRKPMMREHAINCLLSQKHPDQRLPRQNSQTVLGLSGTCLCQMESTAICAAQVLRRPHPLFMNNAGLGMHAVDFVGVKRELVRTNRLSAVRDSLRRATLAVIMSSPPHASRLACGPDAWLGAPTVWHRRARRRRYSQTRRLVLLGHDILWLDELSEVQVHTVELRHVSQVGHAGHATHEHRVGVCRVLIVCSVILS